MASSMNLDPFEMWRQAITKLESGINSLGNKSLNSKELTEVLHLLSTVSLQRQHIVERATAKYLKAVNLPSRKDVHDLADALRRIEDKLDRLLPVPPAPQASLRPARTRQPPPAAVAATAPTAPPAAPADRGDKAAAPQTRRAASTPRRTRKEA